MPDKRFSEIVSEEYTRNKDRWNRYRVLVGDSELLIDEIMQLPGEDTIALNNRKESAYDPVVLRNKIQEQKDILHLSGLAFKLNDSDSISSIFTAENGIGVNGKTQTLRNFLINDVLSTALEYKKAYVVVDRLPIDADQSQADAANNPAPYAYVLNPLQVPAWMFTDSVSMNIHQAITTCRDVTPMDIRNFDDPECEQWTHWSNEEIISQIKDGRTIRKQKNTLGFVPIAVFEIEESLLQDLYKPTMAAVSLTGSMLKGAGSQTYGNLFIFSNGDVNGINMDESSAIQLPLDSKVQYERTPVDGLEFARNLIKEIKGDINEQFKKKMVSMTANAVQQSGISKKMDTLTQEQFSAHLAKRLEEFAPQMAKLFGAYMEPSKAEFDFVTEIPKEFVSRDREADRMDADFLSVKFVPTTKTQFVTLSKLLRKRAGLEDVMSPDDITTDDKEIEIEAEAAKGEIETPVETLPADGGLNQGDGNE